MIPTSIDEAFNHAARRLPDGWVLSIDIEKGYGCFVVYDESGEGRLKLDFDREWTTQERIVEIVEKAREMAQK